MVDMTHEPFVPIATSRRLEDAVDSVKEHEGQSTTEGVRAHQEPLAPRKNVRS